MIYYYAVNIEFEIQKITTQVGGNHETITRDGNKLMGLYLHLVDCRITSDDSYQATSLVIQGLTNQNFITEIQSIILIV